MGLILDPNYLAAQRALARKEIALHNRLPDNYFWNALKEKRDINPARFDHYHPYIAPWFKLPPVVPPPVVCEPLPCPPCHPRCEVPPKCITPPHIVPEPASFILAAIAIALLILYKFSARKVGAQRP